MHKCDSCPKKFNKKYELKRHRTVHENITYTCPYCEKVVKRKPSILKHLRVVHKEQEHIWNDVNFIAQLKNYTTVHTFAQSESSKESSSTDERNNIQAKKTPSDISSLDNGNNCVSSHVYFCLFLLLFHCHFYIIVILQNTGENGEIYKNVFLSDDTASRTILSTLHPIQAISHASEDEMSLLEAGNTVDLVDDNRKQSTQTSLNNIIDDCFFGDDALNCNVVLVHSPFSSDNDVDGFTMNNENGELLNKFHDRLEEMEEKDHSSDFKTIWDHVLDEDNMNDDMCTDDIDENVVV